MRAGKYPAFGRRVIYTVLLGAILLQTAMIVRGLYDGDKEVLALSQSPAVALGKGFGTNTSYAFQITPSRIVREPDTDHIVTVVRTRWLSTVVRTERARWDYRRGLSSLLDQLILWSPPRIEAGPGWSIGHEIVRADTQEWGQLSEIGAGWPFRGIVWRWHVTMQHPDKPPLSHYALLPLPGKALDDPGLEVRPWRLAASLAFTAGLLWLPAVLLWNVTALRCWFRGRRNLCKSCAYPRGGLAHDAPCPECGEPAPVGCKHDEP